MKYRYDIRQFVWIKIANEFFAEAYSLYLVMPDGNIHPNAFPNDKKQFYIDNPNTKGFRRFRFVKEEAGEPDENGYTFLDWIFESEDGIKCRIAIN